MGTTTELHYEPLHKETGMGPVHYNVVNIDRMVRFYRDIIGMKVLRQGVDFAALGTEERELLRMTRVDGPSDRTGGGPSAGTGKRLTTGLYHTAFLVPTKRDLAYLTLTLIDTRTPVQGTSDHGTHLALYLPDPEGNGVELAWDHPREQWPMPEGELDFRAAPRRGVDVEQLLRTIENDDEKWTGLSTGTTVGHIHLHVADLDVSKRFYNEIVGFDVTLHGPSMGASFLSAGGYHHHLGMNVWKGRNLPAPAPDAPGLRYFTVVVPDEAELEKVSDRLSRHGVSVSPSRGPEKDSRDGSSAGPEVWVQDPSGIAMLITPASSLPKVAEQ